ncbi:MAG TPA: hypothetical protein VL221_04815 [Bacteroidota bacterium]|nr:hypothetical protein [Bacteroidota bacterium]
MSAILDVLCSILMGGMLLMNVIDAQNLVAEDSSTYQGDAFVQELLITQVQYIEGEFQNMGYGLSPGKQTILAAGDSSIAFLCDVNRDGTMDTISYTLGPTSELAATQNEMDRYIHRQLNSEAPTSPAVVTYFHLTYITATDDTLVTPVSAGDLGRIKEVEISLEVQNPYALYRPQGMVAAGQRNALYSTSYWQQTRLASQNFRR